MKCDECGKESRTGALEALFERCDVCGKVLCLLCQGALADNHGATHLCPTHYKQVVEGIDILKGERSKAASFTTSWFKAETTEFGEVTAVKVNGVKFVPEKRAGWQVFRLGAEYGVRSYGGDLVGWASEAGACYTIQLVPSAAAALFAYMEKERRERAKSLNLPVVEGGVTYTDRVTRREREG